MCEVDPAERIGLLRERDDVEDEREDLRRKSGDWHKHVASEHGEHQALLSVDVLSVVNCGKDCSACLVCLDGRLELVQLTFKAGEHV